MTQQELLGSSSNRRFRAPRSFRIGHGEPIVTDARRAGGRQAAGLTRTVTTHHDDDATIAKTVAEGFSDRILWSTGSLGGSPAWPEAAAHRPPYIHSPRVETGSQVLFRRDDLPELAARQPRSRVRRLERFAARLRCGADKVLQLCRQVALVDTPHPVCPARQNMRRLPFRC